MCCGRKRRALRDGAVDGPGGSKAGQSQPADATSAAQAVRLLYLRQSPIQIRGMATGRLYHFSTSQPMQSVDSRDATVILRTNLFRQAR